jgi:hypothetical protein
MGKLTFRKLLCVVILLAGPSAIGGILQAQEVKDGPSSDSPEIEPAKVTLGVVENVVLSPWGISFPARIDTGADLSSLDARNIVVQNNIADFKLGKRYGGLRLQLPVIDWRHIQTSMGIEKRPVVAMSICLGSKLLRTPITLKDRSEMIYPFLVGRSALNGFFLVDSSRSNTAQPDCSETF